MIDNKEIMPFNFFKYGGRYSGGHQGMRYVIERVGDKPDFKLQAYVWQGPYASSVIQEDAITREDFDYSEEGRESAIEWIRQQYDDHKDLWDQAPSILDVEPVIHE